MKLKTRSIRRHHKKRMKARAKKIAKAKINEIVIRYGDVDDFIYSYVKNSDHLAMCSCGGCRPRKWEGNTKQEKLNEIKTKEQFKEIGL